MATRPTPTSARRYYAASALLASRAASQALALRGRGIRAVWAAVVRAQVQQVDLANEAVAIMLAEQQIESEAEALLNSAAFVTTAARFERMAEQVKVDAEFERLVASLAQDAARAAQEVAVVARPHIAHVRHLDPPSCSRCAVLAGRVYRWSEGFLRHPQCFPAGTVVSGPGSSRATRRWYEGELVIIRTAGGKELSATGNHPILTDQGWLPANLLTEGSHVLSRTSGDRSRALLVPDHDQVPARIEDVWAAGRMRSLGRVPVAAEDFHGDGLGSSEVDVVLADRLVRDRQQIQFLEPLRQLALAVRIELASALNSARAGLEFGGGHLALAGGTLSGSGLCGALLGTHLGGAQESGFAWASDLNVGLDESATYHDATDARSARKGILALSAQVCGHEFIVRDGQAPTTRWDAPTGKFSTENRAGYAGRGTDLRERLAGRVERDCVVELRRVSFAGHVFNLTSDEGWYDADGIIVSNCDCVMIPTTIANDALTYDPVQMARDGQIRGLSRADMKALEDGADFNKLVNTKQRRAGLLRPGDTIGSQSVDDLIAAANSRGAALDALVKAAYFR